MTALLMTMIRAGHTESLSYGHSYFVAAKEEYETFTREQLKMNAFANRVSQAEQKDWVKFVNNDTEKKPKNGKREKRKMTAEELRSINARLGRIN